MIEWFWFSGWRLNYLISRMLKITALSLNWLGSPIWEHSSSVKFDLASRYISFHLTFQLLAGMEKHKPDNSLFLFDINRSLDCSSNNSSNLGAPYLSTSFEYGVNETIHSLHWFKYQPRSFICGMNKSLKIFDLRDLTKTQVYFPTKAVHGVTVDPFYDHRIASYFDVSICQPKILCFKWRKRIMIDGIPWKPCVTMLCQFRNPFSDLLLHGK